MDQIVATTFQAGNQFAESIRDQIQYGFDWYRELLGMSDLMFDLFGIYILSMVMYWGLGGLYCFVDYYQWPKFIYRYKTHNVKVTLSEITKTAKVSLINQLTVQLGASFLTKYLSSFREMDDSARVPPLSTIALHLLLCILIQEIGYYYIHRLLHHRMVYSSVHKFHHKWQASLALATVYSNPVEHLVLNLFPVLVGPVLLGSHRSVVVLWTILVIASGLNDHAGYHFPLYFSPHCHDYHHLRFNENYGRSGILDRLHGTNTRFLNSKYAKRHKVLLTLTPINVLFPYDEKQLKLDHTSK